MAAETQSILGIDPGIAITGWAMISGRPDQCRLVDCGCIRPRRNGITAERLHDIFQGVIELCRRFEPGEVALEESFYGKNVKSALTIGQVRAAVQLAAIESGTPVFEYPARVVKQAITGRGQAAKSQVGFMIRQMLGLSEPLAPEDVSDAAAIALCHLLRRNYMANVVG